MGVVAIGKTDGVVSIGWPALFLNPSLENFL
jgi:hypothetical protein